MANKKKYPYDAIPNIGDSVEFETDTYINNIKVAIHLYGKKNNARYKVEAVPTSEVGNARTYRLTRTA